MTDHVNERMKVLSSQLIPEGCKELSDKNAHITQVIQYLENSYLSAVHTGSDAERISINIQAKTHVVDILSRVASDIESLATNLDSYVTVQASAVDSLTNQVEMAKDRIMLAKDVTGMEKFSDAKLDSAYSSVPPPLSAASARSRKTHGNHGNVESNGNAAVSEAMMNISYTKSVPGTRLTMEERMSKYDNVGVCLSKEVIKPKVTATNTLNPVAVNQRTSSATPISIQDSPTAPPPPVSRVKASTAPPPPALLGSKIKKTKHNKT